MKVIVFHPGTQHSWQTATALQQLELLEFYATSIFYKRDEWPYKVARFVPPSVGRKLYQEFRRFEHPALDPDLVKTHGFFEWMERIAHRAGFPDLAVKLDLIGNRRFSRFLSRSIRSSREFALWGYNSSSLESFVEAGKHGRARILDRTNGDFRVYNDIMDQISDRYGNYFSVGRERIPDWVIERDDEEYAASDHIVVGSPFAKETLRLGAKSSAVDEKTRVLNYCFDKELFSGLSAPAGSDRNRPVRFLFLGQLIPRKGIHHALEAISRIPSSQATLTLVGLMDIPEKAFAPYADRVEYIPTVARADVPGIMAAHDVFLLPTYFEGAGIVLYEALAAGMAIIQSQNAAIAATPDTGIILDQIDTDHLHGAMMKVVEDRSLLDHFRANAQSEAENYTFARYRDNIGSFLQEISDGDPVQG